MMSLQSTGNLKRTRKRVVNGRTEKQCIVCKTWLEETRTNFYYHTSLTKYRTVCIKCYIAESKVNNFIRQNKERLASALIALLVAQFFTGKTLRGEKPKQRAGKYRRDRRTQRHVVRRYLVVGPRVRATMPCVSPGEALRRAVQAYCNAQHLKFDRRLWRELKAKGYKLVNRCEQKIY